MSAFGSKRWWALYVDVGSYMLVLGCICGVGLYTPAFGSKRRCQTLHAGVGFQLPEVGAGRHCWIVHVGLGPYIVALGCKRQRSLDGAWGHREGVLMGAKRDRRHTNIGIGTSIPRHCVVLGVAPGSRTCSSCLRCSGRSWFLNTVVSGEQMEGPKRGHTLRMLGRSGEGHSHFAC